MNLHLYKVVDMDNCDMDNGNDVLDAVRVMTEKDLRKEFMWAYNQGKIPHELIDDFKADPDCAKENWNDMGNLTVGTMIDMMNDICNYTCNYGYYILETDIEFDMPDKIYESLEEIQAICVGADSPDANTLGDQNPVQELQNCRADLSAISNITEQLSIMIGE